MLKPGQTPGDREGQGNLACCCPWGCKESDMNNKYGKVVVRSFFSFAKRFYFESYLKYNG